MEYCFPYASPLGDLLLTGDGKALTGLWFVGQQHAPAGTWEKKRLPVFDEACRWLDRYFDGQDPGALPPIRLEGTPFRRAVWELLLAIPYGQTRTYGELAQQLARQQGLPSMSAQAVGGAVGHNPIALMIPCHRVVGADGGLVGYAGGLDRKARLLALERSEG